MNTFTHEIYMPDTVKKGELYQKLDALMISQRPESKGVAIYLGSSNQFRTMKGYKDWLMAQPAYSHLKLKIVKGEV